MIINDVFVVCNITIVYDNNLNQGEFLFRDIITNLPVIIPSIQLIELHECINSYMEHNKEIPSCAALYGHFVKDSMCMYAMELQYMQILSAKIVNCYLTSISNRILMLDEVTSMEVKIKTHSEKEAKVLESIITKAIKDPDCDFSLDGDDRLACLGIAELSNNAILYDTNDIFQISTPESLTLKLYHILNESESEPHDAIDNQ